MRGVSTLYCQFTHGSIAGDYIFDPTHDLLVSWVTVRSARSGVRFTVDRCWKQGRQAGGFRLWCTLKSDIGIRWYQDFGVHQIISRLDRVHYSRSKKRAAGNLRVVPEESGDIPYLLVTFTFSLTQQRWLTMALGPLKGHCVLDVGPVRRCATRIHESDL